VGGAYDVRIQLQDTGYVAVVEVGRGAREEVLEERTEGDDDDVDDVELLPQPVAIDDGIDKERASRVEQEIHLPSEDGPSALSAEQQHSDAGAASGADVTDASAATVAASSSQEGPTADEESSATVDGEGSAARLIAGDGSSDFNHLEPISTSSAAFVAGASLPVSASTAAPPLAADLEREEPCIRAESARSAGSQASAISIKETIDIAVLEMIADAVVNCDKELNLMSMAIEDAGLKALSQACTEQGALETCEGLWLIQNYIGDEGVMALADACTRGAIPNLRELYLGQNNIGNAGISALAQACVSGALTRLTELHLSNNMIGNDGLKALSDACMGGALEKCTTLHLQWNRITDEGAQALAAACAGGALKKCRVLVLNGNKITAVGLTAMMDTISNGALNMLRELTLPGGRVPEDLKKRIKKAVVDKGKGGAVKFSHF